MRERERATVLLFADGPFRRELEKQGVPVRVMEMRAPNGALSGVRREAGWLRALRAVPEALRFALQLRSETKGYGVLYANSMKAFLLAVLAKRRGQALVWHLRDILSAEHFSAPLRRAAVICGNLCATGIIANSAATIEAFCREGGRREKATLVYDGVDSAPFEDLSHKEERHLRESLGLTARPVVGLFGRLAPWKGQHILLEAASMLPEIDVLLVGDALFGEEEYAASLRERSAQPDLAGRVHALGFRTDVPALLRCVDIAVHASVAPEPFGLVIVEAMLAGKPVIATRAGGAVEIVGEQGAGLLVAPGSVAELHAALLTLLRHPEQARRMAAEGRVRARQRFPLSAMFRGIEQALARCGCGRQASAAGKDVASRSLRCSASNKQHPSLGSR